MARQQPLFSKNGVKVLAVNIAGLALFFLVAINFENNEISESARATGGLTINVNEIMQSTVPLPGGDDALYTRPIFHQGRFAATPIVIQPVKVAAPTLNLELTGILKVSDQKGWAFLRPSGGSETRQVALGGIIQGWTLKEIQATSAVLVNGNQKITLSLEVETTQNAGISPRQKKPRTRRKSQQ